MITKSIFAAAIFAIVASGFAFGSAASSPAVAVGTVLPSPQATPEKPLNQAGVDSWIAELKSNLRDFVNDEDDIDTISTRWKARKDLVGKTPSQLLSLMFEDVTAVIDDARVRSRIWQNWEVRYKNLKEKPAAPSQQTSEPNCVAAKTEKGTVKSFNATRGYGFINRADGTEIYIHYSAILGTGSSQTLKAGDRVRFVVINDPKGLNAKCVEKIGK